MATPFPFGSGNVLTAAQMNAITTLPINDQTASYVALVGDVGKRIVMNVASGNTVTINNSVFAVGDEIFIACKGAGSTTVTAGAGVTINTASSLVLAQHGGGTLIALSASVFAFFNQSGLTYGLATGGSSSSIVVAGLNYTMLTFTTDSNLVVSRAGLFDCLVVGGAGGAGANTSLDGFRGGGGAGGVAEQTIFLAAATYSIDIGAGGARSSSGLTTRLVTSDLKSLSGVGGGVGGGYTGGTFERIGKSGGCGGGGLSGIGAERQEAGLGLQGFGGGTGQSSVSLAAGSGGGATAAGTTGSTTVATVGGAGYDASTFRGEVANTTFYAGGGSGGGASGGGTTSGSTARATNGAANSGSGGGGNSATGSDNGGSGGSGILLIRFKV
jgi:hypothetical protein